MNKFSIMEVAARLGVSRSRVQTLLSTKELIGAQEMRVAMGIERPVWFVEEPAIVAYEANVLARRDSRRPPEYVPVDIETLPRLRIKELSWLGGIIDGEGYLGLTQKTMGKGSKTGHIWVGYTPSVVVAINSKLVCEKAQQITQAGKVFLKEMKNDKEHWCWRCRDRDAVKALHQLMPFLVEKPYQAELVLRGAMINASYQAERDWRTRLPERTEELRALALELMSLHGGSHKHL